MIEIEKTFIRLGFRHTLLQRQGIIAMYQKVSVDLKTLEVEPDPVVNFEVIKIQHQEHDTITVDSKTFDIPEKEIYPKGIHWGKDGFSFYNRSEAQHHFEIMVKQAKGELPSRYDIPLKGV